MSSLTKLLVTHLQTALRFSNDVFEKVFKRNFHKQVSAVGFFFQRRDAIVFDSSDDDLGRANIQNFVGVARITRNRENLIHFNFQRLVRLRKTEDRISSMFLRRNTFDQSNALPRLRIPQSDDGVIHWVAVFVFRVAHFNIGHLIVEPFQLSPIATLYSSPSTGRIFAFLPLTSVSITGRNSCWISTTEADFG